MKKRTVRNLNLNKKFIAKLNNKRSQGINGGNMPSDQTCEDTCEPNCVPDTVVPSCETCVTICRTCGGTTGIGSFWGLCS